MPQMFPLNWQIMPPIILSLYLLIMINIYFNLMNLNFNIKNMNLIKTNNFLKLKW